MTHLIYLSAPWCQPCKRFRPVVEALAAEREIPLQSVNVDNQPELASSFNVRSVPTLIVLQDGVEVARTGFTTADKLAALIQ